MIVAPPPEPATRLREIGADMDAVAASCAAAIDKLLALSAGGASGELGAKAAALLAADIANQLAAEQALLARG
jgi:hypothetical protein